MNKHDFYNHVPRDQLAGMLDDYPTPCYLYFTDILHTQLDKLRGCTGNDFSIHYALKANPNPDILKLLADAGIGADVASRGELQAAVDAGFPADMIEFSGPGKTDEEISLAIEKRIASINIENVDEARTILETCKDRSTIANVGVRINPELPQSRTGMKMSGDTQFGLNSADAATVLDLIENNPVHLVFTGFHAHVASQELDAEKLATGMREIVNSAVSLLRESKLKPGKLNFGGGWGISYFQHQSGLDPKRLTSQLAQLRQLCISSGLPEDIKLIVEPGRYIVGECGVFVTRVLYRKNAKTKSYLITDGGMNANYILAGGMGQVIRRNFELDIICQDPGNQSGESKVDIAGPLCTPQDVIATNVETDQDVSKGDFVVFFNCGAYGRTASPVYFLSQSQPQEFLIQSIFPEK